MAMELISSKHVASDSATLANLVWRPGDLCVAHAALDGITNPNVPIPGIPAGWVTDLGSGGNQINISQRGSYRVLQSADSSATWTWENATSLIFAVLRKFNGADPRGGIAGTGNNNPTLTYPTLTMEVSGSTILAFAKVRTSSGLNLSNLVPNGATLLQASGNSTHVGWIKLNATSWPQASFNINVDHQWLTTSYEMKVGEDGGTPAGHSRVHIIG